MPRIFSVGSPVLRVAVDTDSGDVWGLCVTASILVIELPVPSASQTAPAPNVRFVSSLPSLIVSPGVSVAASISSILGSEGHTSTAREPPWPPAAVRKAFVS